MRQREEPPCGFRPFLLATTGNGREKKKVSALASKVEGLPKHCKRALGQKVFWSYLTSEEISNCLKKKTNTKLHTDTHRHRSIFKYLNGLFEGFLFCFSF